MSFSISLVKLNLGLQGFLEKTTKRRKEVVNEPEKLSEKFSNKAKKN